MTAIQLAERIGGIENILIPQLFDSPNSKTNRSPRRVLLIAAALAALLALCGFVIYKVNPNSDLWIQNPSSDPVEVVRSAIENQAQKDYAFFVRVDEITIHEAETKRMIDAYADGDPDGWWYDYVNGPFVAVRAKYYVEYDHTKTFYDDGEIDKFFYLVTDTKTDEWIIIDNTVNGEPLARWENNP